MPEDKQSELKLSGHYVTRAATGAVEQMAYIVADGKDVPLCHVATALTGHATVVDYDEHPNYAHDPKNAVGAGDKIKRFLDLGGHKFLGSPKQPGSHEAEVARLRAKHGLPVA